MNENTNKLDKAPSGADSTKPEAPAASVTKKVVTKKAPAPVRKRETQKTPESLPLTSRRVWPD